MGCGAVLTGGASWGTTMDAVPWLRWKSFGLWDVSYVGISNI